MKDLSRSGIIILGVVLGAVLGGSFAWLASSRSEEGDETAIASLAWGDPLFRRVRHHQGNRVKRRCDSL